MPPTNYPQGFRRARAGTLPSNVQLAAQRFAAASSLSSLSSAANSTDSFTDQLRSRGDLPTPTSTSAAPVPVRPGLRHSTSIASSAASSALTERNSRLRSGSLTLPTGGLSNAFGPSIFSSSWLSSSRNGMPMLDDLRSVASMEEDFDVHTLDYLGLDDGVRHPPAATLTELRNQAQAAITVNLNNNPARMRATTVSNPYHLRPSAQSLLAATNAEEEEDMYENEMYHRGSQGMDSYATEADNNYLTANYVAQGFKQSDHLGVGLATRPRAISVGNLDDTSRLRPRAGLSDLQSSLGPDLAMHAGLGASALGPAGILRSEKVAPPRNGLAASVHFPNPEPPQSRAAAYLAAPSSSQNRAVSPKTENASTQMQTPTRSLWIGNLDSSFTSEQLIHVFAPYGAIESLRLLPEKVRAIVFCAVAIESTGG